MKGVGASYILPAKRRWKGLVIGVLGLVFLSMLVPLIFLLGLHNGFHSAGYVSEQQSSNSNSVQSYDRSDVGSTRNPSEGNHLEHIDELLRRLEPDISKDVVSNLVKEAANETTSNGALLVTREKKGAPGPPDKNTRNDYLDEVTGNGKYVTIDENGNCELKFGSYCLWGQEHREQMKDAVVKRLKDQLFMSRAYYPSIVKLRAHEKLSRQLKQNIQELEHILSETITDADLPAQTEKKLLKMDATIARAKSFAVDCNNVDKKLRQIVDLTEDEANFHMKQSAFLYQLAVQTMPKNLHCLSMRLTVEYFKTHPLDMAPFLSEKYMNPALHHYVILSNNILASSVVINSTVMHAEESGNQVFHVLTDRQNYFAMKLWFLKNNYREATVHVMNIEDLNLEKANKANSLSLSLPEEFRISFRSANKAPNSQIRTEYLSVFSHLHYLLPEIFQKLNKIVVLGDDIVVQRDLSALWSINMEGKVNGAVQVCTLRLSLLKNYLGGISFDESSCTWMCGLNVIDLVNWRHRDLTATYWRLVHEQSSKGKGLSRFGALRASLLTFQGLVYALDGMWALSGLGHDYGLDIQDIKNAAVLHYNGNMKPWLELGIPKYRDHWKRFLKREDRFMGECNVDP